MATQNLVSKQITGEEKLSLKQQISQLAEKCNFIVPFSQDDLGGIIKVGDGFVPFLDEAYKTLNSFPTVMPLAFDKEEFVKDYKFAKDVQEIIDELKKLMDGLTKTLTAALSDTMVESLDIYAQVKQNKDKIAGLNVAYDNMFKYFKRSKSSGNDKNSSNAAPKS